MTWIRYRHNEKDTYPLDMSGRLEGGETADSIEILDRYGVTVDSSSVNSAGVISITISEGIEGTLKAKVTTSGGRELIERFQWRSGDRNTRDTYRYYGRY
jgi:hypothetical protein